MTVEGIEMIKAGIVGIAGYGGIELFKILSAHPNVNIEVIKAHSNNGEKIAALYPHLSHFDNVCQNMSAEDVVKSCDVIFTATPHGGASSEYVPLAEKYGKKIIDLSADFRLENQAIYTTWYGEQNVAFDYLSQAVYGLPELHKDKIKSAWLLANPGCYTTASILANAPLVANKIIDPNTIIVDAKSGVSGAGRKPKQNLHYPEMNEGISAYSVASHRHTPEIEQELGKLFGESVTLTFTPHLTPMIRGILSVSYSTMLKSMTDDELVELYREFYKGQPFVRIAKDYLPCTKYTAGSNFIDIAIRQDKRTNRAIAISSIDNLIKGASGQAVQNMNIMFGLEESAGLNFISLYP